MTIISCIKQVQDLDIVLKDDWVVEKDGVTINIDYVNQIMNTYDETSIELMLRLSDDSDIKTKVITLGNEKSEGILRKAMAVGVNEAVRIESHECLDFMPEQVAYCLKTYINQEEKNRTVQMVMCGRQADIGNHGQTGQILAEMLGWPCITRVTDIKKTNDGFKISRIEDWGIEHIYVTGPVVVTITQSKNKMLRMATLKAMLEAKKQSIEVYSVEGFNGYFMKKIEAYALEKLTINQPVKNCIFMDDKDNASKGSQLLKLLLDEKENGVF